jgi:L,D-transpeptidase catalytic domain/Putative peptidoglycan binding domain
MRMSRRVPVLCATLGAAVAMAPAAHAQAPTASAWTAGGIDTKQVRYYAQGQKAVVRGRVSRFVPNQVVTIHLVRKGKSVRSLTAAVIPGRNGTGRFFKGFKVKQRGTLRVVVKHAATPEQPAFRAGDQRISVVRWTAGAGARGTHVLLMQRRLQKLGFAVPVTGYFDDGTARAVTAFRKTNGMGTSGFADAAVFNMLFHRQGAFKLRYPKAGRHVEFDWSRQVLVLARKGRAWRTYHASSGAPATPTVFGTFRFYRKQPGTNAKGMVDSNYFIRGYAIHGYASVPLYPASHGCIRVPIPNAADIDANIALGDRIFVYH